MPLLRTKCGRRRLSELMAGKDSASPRSTRRESQPNQAGYPGADCAGLKQPEQR